MRLLTNFLGLPVLACTLAPLQAAPPGEEVLFQSPDLRIYRTLDREGKGVLVLTNVDENGNFLPGRRGEPDVKGGAEAATGSCPMAAGAMVDAPEPPEDPGPAPVRVKVSRGDGMERPAGEDEIEVRTDEPGGTTIVINITNTPPPPAPPTVVAYPVLAFGGLPGPFRYPDHQPFLGYSHGIGSPSLFSGLGLNAGNRFGLKTGTPCERGYDCLFGPLHDLP